MKIIKMNCPNCGATADEGSNDLNDPYLGLTDEEVLRISSYREIGGFEDRNDIEIVVSSKTDGLCIRKFLTSYDLEIYRFLKDNPVPHMPGIIDLVESKNCLIVIEEYIEGHTVQQMIEDKSFSGREAVKVAIGVCSVLKKLHSLPVPIVHRDIKPSNIMISPQGEVFLLDMDAAKWYGDDKKEDTRPIGTWKYAAPEQFGFGFTSSCAKTDIYAMGILLNEMLTGRVPKEQKAPEPYWHIIEHCINLYADDRYDVDELLLELRKVDGTTDIHEGH